MGGGRLLTTALDSPGYTKYAQRPSSTETWSYLHLFTYRARSPWLPARKPYFSLLATQLPPDPSWHFSEDFRPLLACREGQQIGSLEGSSAKAELPQRPRNSASHSPFGKAIPSLLGPVPHGAEGGLGSGWWASLAAWPAASHVDKRTGEGGSSCRFASQLPSLAALLGELGRVPSEGKGLGPKFRQTGFFSFFFLKHVIS